MSTLLAAMTPGFRDAVHGAQQTFRVLLTAMSRPGLVLRLPADAIAGLIAPHPIGVGAAAVLLALVDAETSAMLVGRCSTSAGQAYLRFHTGARMTSAIEDAAYALAHDRDVDAALWSRLETGSDEAPQTGVTLIMEIEGLGQDMPTADAAHLVLGGPGIATESRLAIAGLSRAFWEWRIGMQSRLPRGIDLILVCGDRLAALPRSTRVTLSEGSR